MEFSRTKTDFRGARTVYDHSRTFDVDFEVQFDPAAIHEIRLTIDTDGLSYDQYACQNGVPDSCDDDLEFAQVERWARATGYGRSHSEAKSIDAGEQRIYIRQDAADTFSKAAAAIADGKIRIAVHPTARDNYSVHSVSIFVIYEREGN